MKENRGHCSHSPDDGIHLPLFDVHGAHQEHGGLLRFDALELNVVGIRHVEMHDTLVARRLAGTPIDLAPWDFAPEIAHCRL